MRAEADTGTHREMGKTTEALFFTMRAEDIIRNGKRQARGCGAGLDGGGPSGWFRLQERLQKKQESRTDDQ